MTVLRGRTLSLRPLLTDDAETLYSYRSQPEVYRYQQWLPDSIDDAKSFIRPYGYNIQAIAGQWNQFAIIEAKSHNIIGDCGFCMCSDSVAEIGYSLMPSVQHQGDGTDCARTLINYLFYQLQLHTIQAITDPENKPSLSLLTRSGFILISFIPKATNIRGVLCDDAIYQLSLQDWEENLHKP